MLCCSAIGDSTEEPSVDTDATEDARELPWLSVSEGCACSELASSESSSRALCFPINFADFPLVSGKGVTSSILEERDRVSRIAGAGEDRLRL